MYFILLQQQNTALIGKNNMLSQTLLAVTLLKFNSRLAITLSEEEKEISRKLSVENKETKIQERLKDYKQIEEKHNNELKEKSVLAI